VNHRATPRFWLKHVNIVQGCSRHPFFTVMKHINVVGIARRVPVQRRRARDITFRVAMCREQPEHGDLNFMGST
jgi:hypothetical protein